MKPGAGPDRYTKAMKRSLILLAKDFDAYRFKTDRALDKLRKALPHVNFED